jgi:hypothetical protein
MQQQPSRIGDLDVDQGCAGRERVHHLDILAAARTAPAIRPVRRHITVPAMRRRPWPCLLPRFSPAGALTN